MNRLFYASLVGLAFLAGCVTSGTVRTYDYGFEKDGDKTCYTAKVCGDPCDDLRNCEALEEVENNTHGGFDRLKVLREKRGLFLRFENCETELSDDKRCWKHSTCGTFEGGELK